MDDALFTIIGELIPASLVFRLKGMPGVVWEVRQASMRTALKALVDGIDWGVYVISINIFLRVNIIIRIIHIMGINLALGAAFSTWINLPMCKVIGLCSISEQA